MPGKPIEELNPHYKKAEKELKWAYSLLGDVETYLKEGNIEEARKAVYSARHAIKDSLHLLGVTEKKSNQDNCIYYNLPHDS